MGSALKHKPTVEEFLFSIVSDADTVITTDSFRDWCHELGYDYNTKESYLIYKGCAETLVRLKQIFTPEQLSDIRTELENY